MVEWKKMWEVTTWDKKFSGVDKHMQPNVIKYYYYLANELVDLERSNGDIRILYTTNKVAYTNSIDVEGTISEGEVVTIPWGGNVNIQYFKGKFVTADNRIATSNNIDYLSNKYLYYWMLSQKDEIAKMYRGAGIQHPSMLSVLSMSVPIPSLSEQIRIVGILDTFTASIENLKEQIAQRRKQYEYYRDQLLDLEGKEGVEMKTLGEVLKSLKTGLNPRKNFVLNSPGSENYYITVRELGIFDIVPVEKTDKVSDEALELINNRSNLEVGDVLFSGTGTIGRTALVKEKPTNWNIKEGVYALKPFKEVINSCYLIQLLHSNHIKDKISILIVGDPIKSVPMKNLVTVSIPVPSIQEQQRIVSILDTFEARIQNLEAQLSQREKQYEYYRNKLLTFD